MREVFHRVEQVAASKSTVLILGESGTGKELVARAIHFRSDRKGGPFVVIDCGTIPDHLQESELFGHMKGSFTGAEATTRGLFEEANGGTVLLDEVGNLSGSSQAKLLRVLQEGTLRRLGDRRTLHIDLRVIAATNQDPALLVQRGLFREDLYYRLNVVPIHLPPLRERREDIPLLVQHFLTRNEAAGRRLKGVSPDAMHLLQSYSWPGNVRELENIIERAVLFSEEEVLTEDLLPPEIRCQRGDICLYFPETPLRLKEAVARMSSEVERKLIDGTLAQTDGNRSAAARLLGISRRALLYKLKAFGITRSPRGAEEALKAGQIASRSEAAGQPHREVSSLGLTEGG
jgi:two-component system response regulator AtoC